VDALARASTRRARRPEPRGRAAPARHRREHAPHDLAILAAGLLIAARSSAGDEVLGTVLLVAAALPALHVLAPWRSR